MSPTASQTLDRRPDPDEDPPTVLSRAGMRKRCRWSRWLSSRGLPAAHVAEVLGYDLAEIDGYLTPPWKPPAGPLKRGPSILAQAAQRTRRLHALGYSTAKIAELLCVPPAAVAEFVARCEPICRTRTKPLVYPRHRAQHEYAKETRRLRRTGRKRPDPVWGRRDDQDGDGLFVAPVEPPPAMPEPPELVRREASADVAATELPSRPAMDPAEWSGYFGHDCRRGSRCHNARLDEARVRRIRELRAAGRTNRELATEFDVPYYLIYKVTSGKSWRVLEDPPPPPEPPPTAPAEPEQPAEPEPPPTAPVEPVVAPPPPAPIATKAEWGYRDQFPAMSQSRRSRGCVAAEVAPARRG